MKYLANKVNSIYFDVLREIGNIGTGSATTSMSVILNTKLSMHMPDARLISIQDLNTIIGSEEEEVVAIYLQIHNGIDGSLMFLLKKNAAYFLIKRLLGKKPNYDKPFDEMDLSAIKEVGNIIVNSYLTAISTMTNLIISPSLPYISVDMAGAILSIPAIQMAQYGDNALVIETSFEDKALLEGYLIFLPEFDSDIKILQALGIGNLITENKQSEEQILKFA